MRLLYHFPMSPFSRRTRLALAHKGLACELLDARADPVLLEELQKLSPLHTAPVLVEDNGHALGDSTAISHYLDRAYPEAPTLWPADAASAHTIFLIASLVDGVLNPLISLGTRLHALHNHEAWPRVKGEMVSRAQGALDALGGHVSGLERPTIAPGGWCAADMWLLTMVMWMEGLPARAAAFPPAAQVLSLGFTLPEGLSRWAAAHRGREDVRALG